LVNYVGAMGPDHIVDRPTGRTSLCFNLEREARIRHVVHKNEDQKYRTEGAVKLN